MDAQDRHLIRLDIVIDSDQEVAALEQALLRARAYELTEVRRRDVRLVAGYGDATTRESMAREADAGKLRQTMIDRLLAALKAQESR